MKSIAVTGALGSFGRRLVLHCAKDDSIERVVAYSRNEFMMWVHQNLFRSLLSPRDFEKIHWFVGDVRDQDRMTKAFWGCEVVVFAAALKRVDSSCNNPTELIETNILGLCKGLEAAMASGVKKFIFISSDKAAHPENFYGGSKYLGEELVRSFNNFSEPRGMECLSTRWGNVLGSRGSVYWIWRKALLGKEPVQLTSPGMTRFYIDFLWAIETVRAAIYQGRAGDLIIPCLESYRLVDFLNAMESVYQMDASVHEIGKRLGGEKLHEELFTFSESLQSTEFKYGLLTFLRMNPQKTKPDSENYRASHTSEQYSMTSEELREIIKKFENNEREDPRIRAIDELI